MRRRPIDVLFRISLTTRLDTVNIVDVSRILSKRCQKRKGNSTDSRNMQQQKALTWVLELSPIRLTFNKGIKIHLLSIQILENYISQFVSLFNRIQDNYLK